MFANNIQELRTFFFEISSKLSVSVTQKILTFMQAPFKLEIFIFKNFYSSRFAVWKRFSKRFHDLRFKQKFCTTFGIDEISILGYNDKFS